MGPPAEVRLAALNAENARAYYQLATHHSQERRHQRRGIGRRALDLLCGQLREEGCSTLVTSWREGAGGPIRCWPQ